jgi:hypothetical protein
VLRIFIRLYFGQHKKTYHPIAYKSSWSIKLLEFRHQKKLSKTKWQHILVN